MFQVFRKHGMALSLLAASGLFLYRGVLVSLVRDWMTDGNYSHGFLVAPIALYLGWQRRARVEEPTARWRWLGLATVLVSLAVLFAGTLGAELFLMRVSVV